MAGGGTGGPRAEYIPRIPFVEEAPRWPVNDVPGIDGRRVGSRSLPGSIPGFGLSRFPAPQPGGRDVGTVAACLQFRPHHILGDPFPAREDAEAAIAAGNDPFTVADRPGRGLD